MENPLEEIELCRECGDEAYFKCLTPTPVYFCSYECRTENELSLGMPSGGRKGGGGGMRHGGGGKHAGGSNRARVTVRQQRIAPRINTTRNPIQRRTSGGARTGIRRSSPVGRMVQRNRSNGQYYNRYGGTNFNVSQWGGRYNWARRYQNYPRDHPFWYLLSVYPYGDPFWDSFDYYGEDDAFWDRYYDDDNYYDDDGYYGSPSSYNATLSKLMRKGKSEKVAVVTETSVDQYNRLKGEIIREDGFWRRDHPWMLECIKGLPPGHIFWCIFNRHQNSADYLWRDKLTRFYTATDKFWAEEQWDKYRDCKLTMSKQMSLGNHLRTCGNEGGGEDPVFDVSFDDGSHGYLVMNGELYAYALPPLIVDRSLATKRENAKKVSSIAQLDNWHMMCEILYDIEEVISPLAHREEIKGEGPIYTAHMGEARYVIFAGCETKYHEHMRKGDAMELRLLLNLFVDTHRISNGTDPLSMEESDILLNMFRVANDYEEGIIVMQNGRILSYSGPSCSLTLHDKLTYASVSKSRIPPTIVEEMQILIDHLTKRSIVTQQHNAKKDNNEQVLLIAYSSEANTPVVVYGQGSYEYTHTEQETAGKLRRLTSLYISQYM